MGPGRTETCVYTSVPRAKQCSPLSKKSRILIKCEVHASADRCGKNEAKVALPVIEPKKIKLNTLGVLFTIIPLYA